MTSRQARHQQRLAAEGFCATSREHGPAEPGSTVCRECREAHALVVADGRSERVEAGLCIYSAAHGRAAPGKRPCQACLDQRAAAARAERQRRRDG